MGKRFSSLIRVAVAGGLLAAPSPPGSLTSKLIGRTLHFAAITGNLDLSSVAVPVTFVP